MWKWVIDCRCSRTLLMNAAIESAQYVYEKFIQGLGFGQWCVESIVRCDQRQSIVINMWYSDSWTCLGQSVHSWLLSSLVPQQPVSHFSECELSRTEAIVRMAYNKMGSNMCALSSFNEEYGFVVRCNICSIMCEVWASTFSPCHDTLALQKALFTNVKN